MREMRILASGAVAIVVSQKEASPRRTRLLRLGDTVKTPETPANGSLLPASAG